MAKGQKNEIVPFNQYAVATTDSSMLAEIIRDNMGGGALKAQDLPKIKVPSGEVPMWMVSGLEGPEASTFLDGVILSKSSQRLYWKSEFGGEDSGSPPDCYSLDLEVGYGDPGGSCFDCPFAQFGTAMSKGVAKRGQACRQQTLLFLLMKDALLPSVLVVPPSSLKPIRDYMLKLSSSGKPYHGVLTRFGLKETKNKDGTKYCEIEPQFVADLASDDRARISPLRSMLMTIDAPAYTANDEAPPF